MSDPVARLNAALEGRYAIEREKLKAQIPWLRVFVEGVVIVVSILLALGGDAWWGRADNVSESADWKT